MLTDPLDLVKMVKMDLNIKIADENFSILNYIIRETILSQNREKLVRGDSYFEGTYYR